MERMALFDAEHRPTGEVIGRNDPVPEGRYKNAVLLFVQNSRGEYLIQKRTPQKNGLLATTGGHIDEGETSLEGLCREVKEEMGLVLAPESVELFATVRNEEERTICDDYFVKMDVNLDELVLQKEEVESVRWMTRAEVEEAYQEGDFMPSHYDEFVRLLERK